MRVLSSLFISLAFAIPLRAQAPVTGTVVVEVQEEMGPVSDALVRSGSVTVKTDAEGRARLILPVGHFTLTIARIGYRATHLTVTVIAGAEVRVPVMLAMQMEMTTVEEITIHAARSERLAGETPIRVEVVTPEDVDMKTQMSPGGITMLLNEINGVRVRTISASLGTGAVRIQGLPGQYTATLSDGLPLYGGSSSSLGPLAISPVDLGRVEVIKGAASALYGGQALGGVIDLISRSAGDPSQLLLNRTTRGVTNGALWLGRPVGVHGGASLFLSGSDQPVQDLDSDGWSDQPEMRQWAVRPRFSWNDSAGTEFFATAGAGYDDRRGGTLVGRVAPDGFPFPEALESDHADVGISGRVPVGTGRSLRFRVAGVTSSRRRTFGGGEVERDRIETGFLEATVGAASERTALVAGAALAADGYRNDLNPAYDHSWWTPGIFALVERDLGPVTTSLSARWDRHPQAGGVVTERVALLARPAEGWSIRLSGGTGYAPGTGQIEETEAIGLRQVRSAPLRDERSLSASVDLAGQLGPVRILATGFGSTVRHAVQLAAAGDSTDDGILQNAAGPTRTLGVEADLVWRTGPLTILGSYVLTHATRTEPGSGRRATVPLTPRHRVALDAMLERPGRYRLGVEAFWYGEQRLMDDPVRATAPGYVDICLLAMRTFGRWELIANVNNALDVRVTDYEPLVRPLPTTGGLWTVDAWGPLDGAVGNLAVRYRW